MGRPMYRDGKLTSSRLPFGIPGRNVAYSISLPWAERYIEGISLAPLSMKFSLLSADFFVHVSARFGSRKTLSSLFGHCSSKRSFSRVLYRDSRYLPGDILAKVDRMSMAALLEARVPMLDHVFLEWVTSLNPELDGKHGEKYILKRLAERLGVPREVLYRP